MINEYFKEVGIMETSNMDDIYDRLEKEIGIPNCMELEKILDGRYGGATDSKVYQFINKTLEGSITFFGGYDFAYLKKTFELIEKYKGAYGKEILDVGCNNGIITCFIAKCCPESHVVGIDTEWEGINIATQLAKKLKLNNVEFQQKNFLKLKRKQFDTIFMFKVVHEIEMIEPKNWGRSRSQLIKEFRTKFNDVSRRIAQNLKPDGILFTIERIPYNIATYGYCLALNDNELHPDMSIYKKIHLIGIDGEEEMPFIYAKHTPGDTGDIEKVFDPVLDQEERGW